MKRFYRISLQLQHPANRSPSIFFGKIPVSKKIEGPGQILYFNLMFSNSNKSVSSVQDHWLLFQLQVDRLPKKAGSDPTSNKSKGGKKVNADYLTQISPGYTMIKR